jgi:hypothetical protein
MVLLGKIVFKIIGSFAAGAILVVSTGILNSSPGSPAPSLPGAKVVELEILCDVGLKNVNSSTYISYYENQIQYPSATTAVHMAKESPLIANRAIPTKQPIHSAVKPTNLRQRDPMRNKDPAQQHLHRSDLNIHSNEIGCLAFAMKRNAWAFTIYTELPFKGCTV